MASRLLFFGTEIVPVFRFYGIVDSKILLPLKPLSLPWRRWATHKQKLRCLNLLQESIRLFGPVLSLIQYGSGAFQCKFSWQMDDFLLESFRPLFPGLLQVPVFELPVPGFMAGH